MNANQKGTALVGGAITDEVMESSDSILSPGMYGQGQKGLQQFYSPPAMARLAAKVIGDTISVLDPTAGDGSLLKEFNPTRAFGVEIDADQIKASEGSYNAIKGDFQHVYTLLKLGISSWPAIVANPPFGLQWSDPTIRDGKPTNSTVLTFLMMNRLLAEDGQFVFICGAGRHERQLTQLPEYSTVYAVIECEDLFEGTREPCAILFGIHDNLRSPARPGVLDTRTVPASMLDLAAEWVTTLRGQALDGYSRVAYHEYASYKRVEDFKTIQAEYDRRIEHRIKTREFDVQLYNGNQIQWYPSAYAKLALSQAGLEDQFRGLNNQPVEYFAQNERLYYKLRDAEERGLITVDPRLAQAVANVMGDIHKHRVPMYLLKPQQRLGFLDDIDNLTCIKDDPSRKFRKGEVYQLDTDTVIQKEQFEEAVPDKKNPGEYVMKTFEKFRKVMKIQLSGNGAFYVITDGGDNATQDISWLIEHFDIPNPGDVATKHPDEIAKLEALVREVMGEMLLNSREWEKTNPTSKPFTIREFQVEDIARLLFKGFGLNAWEQGLGKTAGSIAFYLAATRLGAKEKLLITCPGDLKPQWTREIKRFLGATPVVIGDKGRRTFSWVRDDDGKLVKKYTTESGHGQAKKIARDLKRGGKGIYIVHYEAMSINGIRRAKALPVITVKEWEEERTVKGTDKWGYYYWHRESDDAVIYNAAPDALEQQLTALDITLEHAANDLRHGVTRELAEKMAEYGFKQKPNRGYYIDGINKVCFRGFIRRQTEKITKKLTSRDICPECEADTRNGWNGTFCEREFGDGSKCGYAHFAVKMKPVASFLSTAFHDGVAIVDEITFIQKGTSKRTKAMLGIQARYRLGLTGTPIKNTVNQIFWLMAWTLGYSRPWFPYAHDGGDYKFEEDFCVIQYTKNGRRRENRKVLPDVTNLSRFWRLLASHNIRRRQEETGEELVDIFYHEIKVPLGIAQAEQTREWLKGRNDGEDGGFPAFFKEKYPDHKVVANGMYRMMAPMLGLNWKLDYAATAPVADEDHEWTGIEGLSNYTPANLRAMELTMALVQEGRKVLFGSHLVPTGQWVAERLQEKGVKAVHVVDETSGNTVAADKRADRVYSFQTDPDVQVFCAGMKAIRLGHNLDAANAVVINGLDFDYETLDQFVKRVRRLTSTKDVDVYVMLPTLTDQDTITTRKWQILNLKGNAADLALDGRLVLKNEQEISEAEMLRELQERGLTVTDEAVDEAEVEIAWNATPHIDQFEGAGVLPARPERIVEETVEEVLIDQLAATLSPEVEQIDADVEIEVENEVVDPDYIDPIDAAEAELAALELAADVTKSFDSSPIPVFAGEDEMVATIHAEIVAATEPEETSSADDEGDPLALVKAHGSEESDSEASQPVVAIEEDQLTLVAEPEADVAAPNGGTPNAPAPPLDVMGQIKQAKELYDLGALTDDEFAQAKADLLALLKAGVAT